MTYTNPNVSAVVITRNRADLLRRTLVSLKQSQYPLCEIIVSDDSTDDLTERMLDLEFPEVRRVRGPRRGRSANRNNGIRTAKAEYIVISDDDVLVDPKFIMLAMQRAKDHSSGMYFAATREHNRLILPNAPDFLGFSTRSYSYGDPYLSANSHCFILSKAVAQEIAYDEAIEVYGYEEIDFAYRVAAAGFPIYCVSGCENIHLAPIQTGVLRPEKDASRIYVTFKRHAYIDHRPFTALLFLGIGIPHHILSSIRQNGVKGLTQAVLNISLAAKMFLLSEQVPTAKNQGKATLL